MANPQLSDDFTIWVSQPFLICVASFVFFSLFFSIFYFHFSSSEIFPFHFIYVSVFFFCFFASID